MKKIALKKDFSGRSLFIFVVTLAGMVYLLLMFNRVFIDVGERGYLLIYIILALLLVGLIVLLYPLILHAKKGIKKRMKNKGEKTRKAEKRKEREVKKEKSGFLWGIFKKKIKKENEEEKKAKEIKKAGKIKLKKETEKNPGIFLGLFRKRSKEEIERERNKKEERLRLKEERRKRKQELKIEKMLKKEGMKADKLRLEEEKRKKMGESKEKQRREKIPLVKELSRSLKIEVGKYETDIDILYKIIERNGRIKLSAISRYFGIDERKAEEWATILQEHNLAKIHYPPMGGPELRKKAI